MGSQVEWQAASAMAVSTDQLETVWETAEGDPLQVPPAACTIAPSVAIFSLLSEDFVYLRASES